MGSQSIVKCDLAFPVKPKRDNINGDRENDIQRERFHPRNACGTFVKATGEISVEAADSRQDAEEDYKGWKSEIHSRLSVRRPAAP